MSTKMPRESYNHPAPFETMEALRTSFRSLEKLYWYENEQCLLGTTHILGVPHHITLVRVMRNEDGMQVGYNDPHNRLDDVLYSADGPGQTMAIPGLEGEWVLGVDPYRD